MPIPRLLKHKSPLENWKKYPKGSVERAKAFGIELWATYNRFDATLGLWEATKKTGRDEHVWEPLGLQSFDDFVVAVIGVTEGEADENKQQQVKNARTKAKITPGNPTGSNQHQKKDRNSLYNNEFHTQGTSSSYLLRRLARIDRDSGTDYLDRYAEGEFKSVRAAAIEAGIVKKPTPIDELKRAWKKASKREQTAFLKWIDD